MSASDGGLAVAVVRECVRAGIVEFCICSGARNVELVAVLTRMSGVKRYRFCDERSAGFFAAGRMQVSGKPVAVVTTSGTAAAELLAPMIESHYGGLPLVAITADRPSRFRGSGAPQAIVQPGMFGGYAEDCIELEGTLGDDATRAIRSWSGRRPLHLNVCLEDPSPRDAPGSAFAGQAAEEARQPCAREENARLRTDDLASFLDAPDAEDLIVLLGGIEEASREPVREFLADLGAPVWAEATSGLREDTALRGLLMHGPERSISAHPWKRVLRLGAVPSLRFWRDLEAREETEVFSVSPSGFSGLGRTSELMTGDVGKIVGSIAGPRRGELRKGDRFLAADRVAASRMEQLLGQFPRSETAMVRRLSEAIPREARVFLGNSLPIREWNLAAERETGHPWCYANRGANGIDGQVSSYLGMSAGAAEAWGIFGDLTALCDLGAPWILPQLEGDDCARRFVVLNNGGGRMFARLPVWRTLSETDREAMENPHAKSFEDWARMWGLDYVLADESAALGTGERGVNAWGKNAVIIEVRPDREESERFWEELGTGAGSAEAR